MKKMKNKKAMVLKEVMNLLLAVGCIILLIYISISLYQIFTSKHVSEQASGTLSNIVAQLNYLDNDRKVLVESPENYYIASIANGFSVGECLSGFCLCICDDSSCSKIVSCQKTSRYIVLKDEDNKYTRTIKIKTPMSVILKKENQGVYPVASVVEKTEDFSRKILFLKFDNEWKWNYEFSDWKNSDVGIEELDKTLYDSLKGKTEAEGKEILKTKAIYSDNIIILSKEKKI